MLLRFTFLALSICLPSLLVAKTEDKPIQGWLGVVAEEMSPAMLTALGIENGVLIAEGVGDGPAAKAGLQMGDVIVEIDGINITSLRDLLQLVRSRPGKKVELIYYRRQERYQVTVEIGRRKRRTPEQFELKPPASEFWRSFKETWEKLQPQWRRSMEIYKRMLDSLQQQLEETRKELRDLQRRLKEESR